MHLIQDIQIIERGENERQNKHSLKCPLELGKLLVLGGKSASLGGQSASLGGQSASFGGQSASLGGQSASVGGQKRLFKKHSF